MISAALPVIVVTFVCASTVTLVIPSIIARSPASAVVSVTTIVNALFEFASVNVFNVATSPLEIAAVITPVVKVSAAIA